MALCAAKTKAEKGDIYLDDIVHHALFTKFAIDMERSGSAEPILLVLMIKEEAKGE